MKRTAPFSKAAIRNACIAAAFAVAPVGLFAIGTAQNAKTLAACNSGETLACHEVADTKKAEITNEEFLSYEKVRDEALAQAKADAEKQAAASKKRQAEALAAEAKALAAAEAKFKAEGWFQLKPGIYGRWCTQTCSRANVIGSSTYWLLEVWAKDRAAGDIYSRINILRDGVVVGWTNDTAYLSKGQRGVLTFSKYRLPGSPSSYSAQLTEFNARG